MGYGVNLPTGNNYNGQYDWHASPGGFVDRNDDQYNAGVDVVAGLPATITKVNPTIPARSGETDVKRFAWLSADTTFAITGTSNKFSNEVDRNAGIFLSRRTEGGSITFNSTYTQGLYYSSWYYFTQTYTSSVTANQNLMVMEFMVQSGTTQDSLWRRPWTIHLQGKAGNKMAFRVDEWSGTLMPTGNPLYENTTDPNNARKKALIVHKNSPLDVPINKWVHLEVFYKHAPYIGEETMAGSWRGKSNGGQVIVYQDGIEIYRFDNVATSISTTETLISNNWIVTAYAHKSLPSKFEFYVDDAAISTTRLGAPREMLANGDFSSDTSPWILDNPYGGTVTVAVNAGLSISNSSTSNAVTNTNALLLDITGPGQPLYKPSFYQTIAGGIISGTSYTLRFSTRSDVTQPTYATIQHNSYADPSGNWQNYWSSELITLTSTTQNYVYQFTAGATATNVNLLFRAGSYTRKIWLDNVSLVYNDNMLHNGDFADGTPHWILNRPNRASYSTVTNAGLSANNPSAAQVIITDVDTAPVGIHEPELYQVLSGTVETSATYTLRFTAKSLANRPIRVALQRFGGDWARIGDCGFVDLTPTAQNFVCSISDMPTESNVALVFFLGKSPSYSGSYTPTWNTTVWIDNVSLSHSQ